MKTIYESYRPPTLTLEDLARHNKTPWAIVTRDGILPEPLVGLMTEDQRGNKREIIRLELREAKKLRNSLNAAISQIENERQERE